MMTHAKQSGYYFIAGAQILTVTLQHKMEAKGKVVFELIPVSDYQLASYYAGKSPKPSSKEFQCDEFLCKYNN